MTSPFKSKEKYLQYRTTWKQRYKALSAEIRICKAWRREEARLTSRVFGDDFLVKLREPKRTKVLNEFIPADKLKMVLAARKRHLNRYQGYSADYTCRELRAQASAMMEDLKVAKEEAQKGYLEERKSLPAMPLNT